MLKSIEIKNFKSFKEKTIIDLERTNYQALSTTNTVGQLLKGALFVGANASGKSNVILAVKFLLDCLVGKFDVNVFSCSCLFSNEPVTELTYRFVIDDKEIKYSIQFHRFSRSIKEVLTVDTDVILDRDDTYAKVNLGSPLKEYTDVPKSSLFLRDIYFNTKFRGFSALQKWFDFLENSIYIDLYDRRFRVYKDVNLKFTDYLKNGGVKTVNDFFILYNFGQTIEYGTESKAPNDVIIHTDEETVYFKRKGIDFPIPFPLESMGNKNLIFLLPFFFHNIENGGMLIMDEFSSGFHNELEQLLIRYFMENSTNSQLLFVSHSTNLLSTSLLRPDQIYSVEFDNNGSHVKRFSSEGPREAQNLEKMYLSGVFRGVPLYGD